MESPSSRVQDGMLETVGKILDRMSELKGLASQDPMKNEMDRFTYNNEFRDLQLQLYAISQGDSMELASLRITLRRDSR